MTPKNKKTAWPPLWRGPFLFVRLQMSMVQNTPYVPKRDIPKNEYIYNIKDYHTVKSTVSNTGTQTGFYTILVKLLSQCIP